jgi:hypothetical protein
MGVSLVRDTFLSLALIAFLSPESLIDSHTKPSYWCGFAAMP